MPFPHGLSQIMNVTNTLKLHDLLLNVPEHERERFKIVHFQWTITIIRFVMIGGKKACFKNVDVLN